MAAGSGMWLLYVSCSSCLVIFLVVFVLNKLSKKRRTDDGQVARRSLMVVAGSGGHTAEILRLVGGLDDRRYWPRIYVVADTDTASSQKIKDFEHNILSSRSSCEKNETSGQEEIQENYIIVKIPRSREVHQSWPSTVVTTFISIIASILLVAKWKPNLIVCNGPGTCVPVCLVALVLRTMTLRFIPTKIVYVESVCRVYDLSLSGKILHKLVDRTIVQWPELHSRYPKTMFVGRLY